MQAPKVERREVPKPVGTGSVVPNQNRTSSVKVEEGPSIPGPTSQQATGSAEIPEEPPELQSDDDPDSESDQEREGEESPPQRGARGQVKPQGTKSPFRSLS